MERPVPRLGLYPGSFDPVTRGHLDVIERAGTLFDRLVVGVVENPAKVPLFSLEERLALLREAMGDRPAVEVVSFRGLTVDLARRLGARWIVRGIRSGGDLDLELAMARTNRTVSGGAAAAGGPPIETVFLPSRAELSFVEARFVREIAAEGGDVGAFVTPAVEAALRRKLRGR